MAKALQSAFRERGVFVTDTELEGSAPGARILVPLLECAATGRRSDGSYAEIPGLGFSSRISSRPHPPILLDAAAAGRVFDPAGERFRSTHERERTLEGIRYEQSGISSQSKTPRASAAT